MTHVLRTRGPDGQGTWMEPRGALALGHRRLSILDLSPQGKQPMVSESGRYVITYNGEIYNLDELRSSLARDPASFRGHSDTEVALAVIEKFGLTAATRQFNGMFAFALWDRDEQALSLVRDRLGIKPLFYGNAGSALLFGSQSSSLRKHAKFDRTLDPVAITAYLQSSCIPGPLCVHRDAHKVLPGTIVRFSSNRAEGEVEQYWDPLSIAMDGQRSARTDASPASLVEELDELLTDAVARRMVADVPLGAFLSGGVDSSMVVALMAKVSSRPVQTFTIGSEDASYDESSEAETIAKHLGTDHHNLVASPQDAIEVATRLSEHHDEPFADSSQIPTFLVSRLAREHVTVSLSGDGGDELFGGYNRHNWGPRLARINQFLPAALRIRLGTSIAKLHPETLDRIYKRLIPQVGPLRMRLPADKAIKFAGAISSTSDDDMYRILANANSNPAKVLNPDFYRQSPNAVLPPLPDIAHKFMFQDMTGYLPNDILTKVDRASMGVSLEARVPLLDHRVVEFAWALPLNLKLAEQGKWILRKTLARYIPPMSAGRPKAGFSIPIGAWLRGPLRGWANELLDPTLLESRGIFQSSAILKVWREHLNGSVDHSRHLWDVLVLQDWLDRHIDAK